MSSPAFVGYDVITTRKPSLDIDVLGDDREISRQIDELQRISQSQRDKVLGRDYFSDIEEFYNLEYENGQFPSFKPRVSIPQLQTLVLNEATDITDSAPRIYISSEGERDKDREKWYQANWRQGCYNNRILESFIWAMLSNLGFLQVGFDPLARRGRGSTWLEMRNPKSVFPDPYAKSDADWSFLIFEDWMYLDEVYRRWPEKGRYVRPHLYSVSTDPYGNRDGTLEFPEASPLSQQSGGNTRKIFRDNRVRVRHCYMFDNTREVVRDYAGTSVKTDLIVPPRYQYTYPDGRWITECEEVILADGNNWCPQLPDDERGTFPLIRLSAMPCVTNFWGPPPVRLTRSLQRLAERTYTQAFENLVRLNNGVIVITNNSGLDPTSIGWLPGEVLQINQGAAEPKVLTPPQFPAQTMQMPAALLALQKELQGFAPARQGDTGSGNLSPDLFDAALWQSKPMTRLRGRLLAESLQRLASIIFYVQCRYQRTPQKLSDIEEGEYKVQEWTPTNSLDEYDLQLDPGSLQVLSATMLRSVVSALAKSNMIPTKTVLETLGVPNAGEIAEEKTRELEIGSMAKLKRPR